VTILLMIYGTVVALLLAGGAHFLDRGLRALGKPTRWVWIVAMAGGALAPFIPKLFPASLPETPSGAVGLPMEVLYEVGALGAGGTAGSAPVFLTPAGSLSILWALSSLFVLVVFAGVCLRLRRQRRTWERREVRGEEVLLSKGLGPAVLGLIRPRIVLPPWALTLAEEKLDLVVLHEREHREARDPALLAGGLFLTALSPWNLVLWWTLQRLRLAVEGDCDARVLAGGVQAKSYVRLLLEVASRGRGLPAMAPALTEGGDTFLEKRLLMIRSFVGQHRAWATASAVVVGAAFIVLACETPMPPEAPEEDVASEITNPVLVRTPLSADEAEARGEPLLFIDDVLVKGDRWSDKTSPSLSGIDPDDIELIRVIKGDSARTLYGEKGAEGAILITTKAGGQEPSAPAEGAIEAQREGSQDEGVPEAETPPKVAEIMAKSGEGNRVLLRGVNRSDPSAQKPLVFIDGVLQKVDEGNESGGSPGGLAGIDPEDIERIEVIKGENAVARYGADAAAGVILIFTKKK
jgi:TonB-dependent SusC/RagA subfamily outer membrane receptor